jgi:hypothetical protein
MIVLLGKFAASIVTVVAGLLGFGLLIAGSKQAPLVAMHSERE